MRWRASILVGVEPGQTDWGYTLSPPVASARDKIVAQVKEEVDQSVRTMKRKVAT